MTKRKRAEPIQIHEGVWYAVASGGAPPHVEECCDCGLTHVQEWKIDNGRIYFRYKVDKRPRKRRDNARGIRLPKPPKGD